jgi:hypothetical protein
VFGLRGLVGEIFTNNGCWMMVTLIIDDEEKEREHIEVNE